MIDRVVGTSSKTLKSRMHKSLLQDSGPLAEVILQVPCTFQKPPPPLQLSSLHCKYQCSTSGSFEQPVECAQDPKGMPVSNHTYKAPSVVQMIAYSTKEKTSTNYRNRFPKPTACTDSSWSSATTPRNNNCFLVDVAVSGSLDHSCFHARQLAVGIETKKPNGVQRSM